MASEELKTPELEIQDGLGYVIRWTMYHLKSIEHRFRWSRAQYAMKASDKAKCNALVKKVEAAIMEYSMFFKRQEVIELVHGQIRDPQRMVEVMFLTEALYDLETEDLGEVTTLVENYIKQKHDTKRQDNPCRNEVREHPDRPVHGTEPESQLG